MPQIIECIPNFSEGRNPAIVQALMAAVQSVPDVRMLNHTMDGDHHRSVLTFAGPPEAVGEAAYRAVKVAAELIDLRRHDGGHPRVGATDVVPFVPIQGVTMEECVQLARHIGRKVAADLGIPVFLYEQAATHPDRVKVENIRRGGLQGLASRMESNPAWAPDFGPKRLHETAGAVVIGARRPLIAFNVNLKTADLTAAKAIAKAIRHSNGGLPCLKAIGVELASRGMVQVSMNLTDYRVTSMHTAFQAAKTEAARRGVEIAGSELIGLAPQAALDQTAVAALQLERFDPALVLESRIAAAMSGSIESNPTLSDFLNAVAASKPTPAGGSVAALVGALAASLGVMGARLGHQAEAQQQLVQLSQRLHALVQADVEAYEGVSRAGKLPKENPERSTAFAAAMQKATEIPLETAELACEAGWAILSCLKAVKPAIRSDLMVGMIMATAAVEAGLHTAQVNIKAQTNQQLNEIFLSRITKTARSLEELRGLCYTPPPSK
jgi:glutamate formiminotransferase/glutamate formiminotransferase/formiminotetrahydrofolate cyclodeaminase